VNVVEFVMKPEPPGSKSERRDFVLLNIIAAGLIIFACGFPIAGPFLLVESFYWKAELTTGAVRKQT
jgi:hypothetical protein